MITIQDWETACKTGTKLYFWDGDDVIPIATSAYIQYDTTQNMWFVHNQVWFRDIYKSKKDCAEDMMTQFKERYL